MPSFKMMTVSRACVVATVCGAICFAARGITAEPDGKGNDDPKSSAKSSGSEKRGRNRDGDISGDAIAGYTIRKIQGFTVIINNEVLRQDVSKFERKPMEVLDLELSEIVSLLPPNATAVLRRLLIWVEWDEQTELSNGRNGTAAAVYYGGHQLQLLKSGKHPLKAKSVTVLSMLALTKEHQPDRDSGRCVLLHEMAHAVHNELLGRENAPVKQAYQQAMRQNLYEKHLYAATNEQEFFAEVTCAYFDQLHYFPKTRAELEKHDPVTFRLMQEVWGKRPIAKAGTAKNDAKAGSEPTTKSSIQLAKLDFGTPVQGDKITPADLAGKPVVLVLWNAGNGSSLSCLSRLQGWDDELRNFGLVTVAQHLTGKQTVDVAKVALDRNLAFAVSESKWTNLSPVKNFTDFPLCLVFDHAGNTIYEGSPFDAEQAVRKAVGRAIVDAVAKQEMPKPLAAIVEALKSGSPPQSQLPKLAALARSKTAAGNELAAGLLERMTQAGRNELDAAREATEKDPVAAFVAFEKLAAGFKGSPLGTEATQAMGKLRPQKPVQLEIQARQVLALIKKIDTELNSKPGSFDPLQDRFQSQNAGLIKELRDGVQRMEKTWPKAIATREALAIGRKYSER